MKRSVAALVMGYGLAAGPAFAAGCEAVRLTVEPADQSQAVAQVLRRRLQTAGMPATVEAEGAGVRVLAPEGADSLLTRPARVEFRIVAAAGEDGAVSLARAQGGRESVEPEIILDENHLRGFRAREEGGRGILAFRFDPHAMKNLMAATADAVGRKLAILVDDVVVAEPEIRAPVASAGGEIDVAASPASARELAALLPDGRLPARVAVASREAAPCKTN